MAYNPSSFTGTASLPVMGSPGIASAPEQIAKGFNLSQMPEKARTAMLANALARMKNEQEPQRFKSEQDLRAAQMQKGSQDADKMRMVQEYLKNNAAAGNGVGDVNAGDANNDLMKSWVRKQLGMPEETPGEKQDRDLDTAEKKKQMESQYLTSPARSEHEQVMSRAPQFIRGLQQLIDNPSPADFHMPFTNVRYRPAAYKKHESNVNDLGETFARLRGYPQGQGGQEKAIGQLERATGETDFAYRERLKKLFPEIAMTTAEAARALNKPVPSWAQKILSEEGQPKSKPQDISSLSNEELIKIVSGGR